MAPIASAKISTPTKPCQHQKSPKNPPHQSLSSQVKLTTGAPAVRANPNPSVTVHTKAQSFHPFPTPPKKTAPFISAPANKAPTASSATVRTKHCPDSADAASRLKNGPCEDDGPPKITTRAAALNLGGQPLPCSRPCSLRPLGHLRCASSAPPGASVGLTQD